MDIDIAIIKTTFKKGKYDRDIINTLIRIKDSDILKKRWGFYSRKNNYAKDISYGM